MNTKIRNKYVKIRKKFIENYEPFLIENKDILPNKIDKGKYYKSDSWFSVKGYDTNKPQKEIIFNKLKKKETFIKAQKITMKLNSLQKQILHKWFEACTNIYNAGITYIRSQLPLFKDFICKNNLNRKEILTITNKRKLRNALVNESKNIINNSQLETINDKNTKIYKHILDATLFQLSANIKSAVTNTIRGNFKRFRFKYWKHTRPSHTIDIEKSFIENNKICFQRFGEINYIYNNKPYTLPEINHGVKINYNRITDNYTLLIPIDVKTKTPRKGRTEVISLDPGLRTFMTGLSEDCALKIGSNVNKHISSKIKRINKIKNNEKIPLKIKRKNERMINRKIAFMVDDLHWKSIKLLTDNFSTIYLGDMSAKSIVKRNKSVLSAESKVACLRTKYYEFRQRLEYKCKLNNVNYSLVDEHYTSKICSLCCWYNNKLTSEKIFNCEKCSNKLDRDINGCRNIFLRGLKDSQLKGTATVPYKLNITAIKQEKLIASN